MGERLTSEQVDLARATYEQLQDANAEWQATLATRGWSGYIAVIAGALYRASQVVDRVGVELAGDSADEVLALIDRLDSPAFPRQRAGECDTGIDTNAQRGD